MQPEELDAARAIESFVAGVRAEDAQAADERGHLMNDAAWFRVQSEPLRGHVAYIGRA